MRAKGAIITLCYFFGLIFILTFTLNGINGSSRKVGAEQVINRISGRDINLWIVLL